MPVELLGGVPFPADRRAAVLLTLGGYGFYWFRLTRPATEEGPARDPRPVARPCTLRRQAPAGSAARAGRSRSPAAGGSACPGAADRRGRRSSSTWSRWPTTTPRAATEHYQVPLACYPEPQDHLEHALRRLVGRPRPRHGPRLRRGPRPGGDGLPARGVHPAARRRRRCASSGCPATTSTSTTHSTLFRGEQSNSSVAFGEDALLKVFRKITPGRNPDITVHDVLTRAGSDHVAALYGWIEADSLVEGEVLQLAMLQQFLRTASDGWELALASVRNLFAEADLHADEVGGDFAGEAARLGVALRETHDDPGRALPDPTAQRRRAGRAGRGDGHPARRRRVEVVPELAEHADAVREVFDATAGLDDVPRPADPRRPAPRPDAAHRQGLEDRRLRGRARQAARRAACCPTPPGATSPGCCGPSTTRRGSSSATFDDADRRGGRAARLPRRRVVRAQPGGLPRGVRRPRADAGEEHLLLAAYVADKAVYEAVYEARNRPTWVSIPLDAISPSEALMTATVLPVPREELDLLVRGEHGHPHALLGPHPHEGGVTVRVLKPLASSVVVTWDGERVELDHEHEGVWVGVLPAADVPGYRLEVAYGGAPVDARRPLPLPAHPGRGRPAPHQRGPPREPLGGARRARPPLPRAARRRRSPARRSRCGRPRPAASG